MQKYNLYSLLITGNYFTTRIREGWTNKEFLQNNTINLTGYWMISDWLSGGYNADKYSNVLCNSYIHKRWAKLQEDPSAKN